MDSKVVWLKVATEPLKVNIEVTIVCMTLPGIIGGGGLGFHASRAAAIAASSREVSAMQSP